MIVGSLENDMEEVQKAIVANGNTTVGLNLVELAEKIYNNGNTMNFEVAGIIMEPGDKFRFNEKYPWSTIPSDGHLSFSAVGPTELYVKYLEIDSAEFKIYFVGN